VLFVVVVLSVLVLLHLVPWSLLVLAPGWPGPWTIVGTVLFVVALAGLPAVMVLGHGRRHLDPAAVVGDIWLGVIFQLFTWSLLGQALHLALVVAGVGQPSSARIVAISVVSWVAVLCGYGAWQAMRVPPVRRTEIVLERLGVGLDGLRVVLLADTHYGPIDRARWSRRVATRVTELDADIVCHAGDLADGPVEDRRRQVAPLGAVSASLARAYITGNHEYFSGAVQWIKEMERLGWTVLHNRHVIVERDGSRLVLAGVDDRTAAGSGLPGHGADLAAALRGADPDVPVIMLAHQPKQVGGSAAAGVDLQLSGHTHGGQIWPFHLLVRAEQGALHGLRRVNARTQLYTTRGTGFWGPPFRVFAPSEITLLVLRAPHLPPS
jgi:uncharacterized protein